MKRFLHFTSGSGLALLAALFVATSPLQGSPCTPPAVGLVAWWPGEGNANDIAAAHHGTLQGGATFAPGKVGWGFRFDGTNGYAQIPDSDALKPANITCEVWVWLDPSLPAHNGGEQIVFKKNTWAAWFEGYSLLKTTIDNGDGTYSDRFQFCVSRFGNQVPINSLTIAQRGVWYHVAATYDGNQSKLYVNGVLEATATPGFALDYDTTPIFIGTSGTWAPYLSMFGGIIDELSIYNRALSASEIAAINNAGSAGKCSSVAAAVPVITSFSPVAGTNGTTISISGTHFSESAAANTVYFGAVRATVLAANPTNLAVAVPPGATFGPITVNVGGLATASGAFFEPTFPGTGAPISAGSFAPSFNLGTGSGPGSCVIADLDGDGKPDLALVCGDGKVLSIFRNLSTNGTVLGAASFAPVVNLAFPTSGISGNPYRIRAVDLDGDGKLDLIACEINGNRVSVFHNLATPGTLTTNSFDPAFALVAGSDCRFATAADLDGDGRADVVALNYGAKSISLFKNVGVPGSLTTNSFAPAVRLTAPGGPYELAIADLDGDGKPDLAAVNSDSGTVSIFQNSTVAGVIATNSFLPAFDLPAGTEVQTIAAVDLDGDGKLDLTVGSILNNSVGLLRNVSQGGLLTTNSFAPRIDFGTPGWAHTVTVADFNGDGKPDLGVVGELPSYLSIFQNTSTPGNFTTSTFAPRADFGTGWNAWGITAGDLDGDGRPDVVFCNAYDSTLQIYQNVTPFGLPLVPPTILTQPTNLTVTATGTAVLNVVASGSTPLNYQWSYNGTNLASATNATLILSNLTPAQAGSYAVVVANAVGSIASSNAVLTVIVPPAPPVMLAQSPNQVVLLGGTATFSVTASNSAPMNYFWLRNGTLILAATNSSYSLFNAQLADSGSKFICLVSNANGTAMSTAMTLKVIDTVANDLCSGAIAITNAATTNLQSTLRASAWGDPLPDCVDGFGHGVWYQFTAPASGRLNVDTFGSDFDTGLALYTGSCDTLTELACNDDSGGVTSQISLPTLAGMTYFILAGGYSSDAGNLVLHLNHLTPPTFAIQPTNTAVIVSSNASFATSLSGSLPMSLQWYFNNAPLTDDSGISGSTNACLTIANVQTNNGGNYQLVASNIVGVTTSSVAMLTPIILPPVITVQPISQTATTGSNVFFTVSVTGTPPYNYQWYSNGNPLADDGIHLAGSATNSLSISNLTTADAGNYTLHVNNISGSDNSAIASLTVLVPPVITVQPVGRSVPPGMPTTFNASATGIPTPSLQWQLNGTNIPGATGTNYTASTVGSNDLGFYHLFASNSVGTVSSTDAQLTYGPVAAWGRNLNNESLPPPNLSQVVAVAGTSGAGFAVRADGSLVAWAGSGAPNVTKIPANATNVIAISTSANGATAVLRADGAVVGWNGTALPALTNIISVAMGGSSFGLALRTDGTIIGWGTTPYSSVPTKANNATAIACGYTHSLALRTDGTVIGWGTGAGTNVPAGLAGVTGIAAGLTHSLALKTNGTVVAWGSGTGTNLPAGLTNIAAVYASAQNLTSSYNFSLAVRSNGTVVAWGDSPNGETNPPAALNHWFTVAASAAPLHGLALLNDGSPQILQPPVGLTAYTGRDAMLPASAAGAAPLSYQWLLNGTNLAGATNSSLSLPNIQLANAGSYQLLVSNAFGTTISLPARVNVIIAPLTILSQITVSTTNLYQAGKFTVGGLAVQGSSPVNYQWFFSPTNKNYTAMVGATNPVLTMDPALAYHSGNYYLAASNLVGGVTSTPVNVRVWFARAWGYNAVSNPPVNVTNAVAVATGGSAGVSTSHYLALGADGKVTGWANGTSYYGEATVSALTNYTITAIAAGYQHSLALKSDGTVYAWGYGGNGQTNPPSSLSGVTAIACGGYHDLALKTDGTVVAWGDTLQAPVYGQATNNPAATNVVAIAAGTSHSLALRADGSVVSWGYPDTLVTALTTNIVAIAAGNNFSVGLRTDGKVMEWGGGIIQYQVPANLSNVVAISASGTHVTALKNDGTVVSWGSAYSGLASNSVPADTTNVAQIACGGDHDFALLGTRTPQFTVQPWNRTIANTATSVWFSGKCVGVQPVSYQWQANGTNIPAATNDTLVIGATRLLTGAWQPLASGVYQLVASNAYGVTVSKYAKLSVIIPLGIALNTTNTIYSNGAYSIGSWLNWTSTGATPWYGQTNYSHDGISAARSGGIGGSQSSDLTTTLVTNVAGNVTFWWKVSSEQFFDTLDFRINGNVQAVISGEVNWQQASFPIAAGTNVLQWHYAKDPTFDSGLDAGFVDQFSFTAPPNLTHQPSNLTNYQGSAVAFSVTTTGTAPLSYQWLKNGTVLVNGGNVSGANSSILTLNPIDYPDAANYSVIVTNLGGRATSSPASLTILNGQPVMVTSPAGATNNAGTAVTFPVIATGASPLTYQWQKNGVSLQDGGNVGGSTTSSLTLTNVQENDAAAYLVIITNNYGSITSSPAVLAVIDGPPVINNQPTSSIHFVGTTAIFETATTGTLPITYQWQFNGTNLDGATNAVLNLTNVRPTNAGSYCIVATNAIGSATSSMARLVVTRTRVIAWGNNYNGQTNVPPDLLDVTAISAGDTHSLALQTDGTVMAWGDNVWGEINVPAGMSNVLAIAGGESHSLAVKADHTVAAWGTSSNGITNGFQGLTNITAIADGEFFSVAIHTDGTVTAWGDNSFDRTNVPVELTNAVAIAAGDNHGLALQASGTVVAWGYNGNGETSVPAGLTNAVAIAAGNNHSMALRADGSVAAWGYNGSGQTNVPGDLTNAVAITADGDQSVALKADGSLTAWGDNSYEQSNVAAGLTNIVAISGGNGHLLAIQNDGSPYIIRQTGNQTAATNTTVNFTVTTLGAPALGYQWRKNGANLTDSANIAGSATATLILANVQASDAGVYSVIITNLIDSVTSAPALLTLSGAPAITLQPVSQTANMGTTVQLSVAASGYPPPTYQWRQNGNIIGSNSPTLILNNVGRAQSGIYFVTITNASGSNSSSNAIVKVRVPQVLGPAKLLPNGWLLLSSTDADGGAPAPADLVNFEVQTSSNLVNWVTLPGAPSLTNGTLMLLDKATKGAACYYRIIEH